MAFVEGLCVAAEQPLQPARQLGLRCVKDEVVVGRHQAERVNSPAVALEAEEDLREKRAAIRIVAEDRAAVDAARHDVEVPVGQRRSKDARHHVGCTC
ncbi:MAG: hypothetical protein ACRDQT_03565, partial [Gaiellaceae bacterium]